MKDILEKALIVLAVVCIFLACLGTMLYQGKNNKVVSADYQSVEIIELPEVEEVVEEAVEVQEDIQVVEPVKSDMQVIAEVVMSEGGNQPLVGKVAIAATMLNSMEATGRTAESIALEAYAYPYYGIVTNECYRAVEIAMDNRDLFPSDMMYFRTKHYHDFGYPYCQIGDHYFSTKGEN